MSSESKHRFLPVASPDIGELEMEFVVDAVRSGWVSSAGPYVERFEREFAAYCGVRHAIALANGTVALHLALVTAGVGPGDEVIVPALTFVATAAVVRQVGAEPVFVDSDEGHGCMSPAAVQAALSQKTRAIIPVHLYGHAVDMDSILILAKERGVLVIEDAAEAHGATYRGRRVGGIGDVSCFSFYGNKIVTTGEGGMLLTNDEKFAERARVLKDHAMSSEKRYWHTEVGYNYRMTNIQAALGCAQLKKLDSMLARRAEVLAGYRIAMAGLPVEISPAASWCGAVSWLVNAILPTGLALKRAEIMLRLKLAGIDTRPYFYPACDMPPYVKCRRVDRTGRPECGVAADLSTKGFSLPSGTLIRESDIQHVSEALGQLL